jgi:hypothetical protein
MKAGRLSAWWGQRPLREKLMLVVGGLGAMAALTDTLVTAPMDKKLRRTVAETQALEKRLETARMGPQADAGQAAALREQEAMWRERLLKAQGDAAVLRQRVADSARLPETLRAITATVGAARLLELDLSSDNETAAAPSAAPAVAASAAAGSPGVALSGQTGGTVTAGLPRLYRLPITLKVSGSYSELHTLLTQFERHAEALQWSSLTLDNAEWPAIQMTLKAHVVSHSPRWGASS